MRTDPTSKNYPVRLRTITIFVITGIALLAYLFPRFLGEPKSIQTVKDKVDWTVFEIPPDIKIEIPERPDKPDKIIIIDVPFEKDPPSIPPEFWIPEIGVRPDLPPSQKPDWPPFVIYDRDPIPLSPISPEYPDDAVKLGIEGTVHVQVYIDKYGIIQNILIIRSDSVMLNEAALDAVKKTRWDPARQRDKKVGVTVVIPIKFQLH
ncbi:MAG: energy transducer TonB [Candidatus Marinimicrobia bacterium]|nr:energy transducer TonB [Candidatus Neomarinimicrobiota bacterium]